MKEKRTEKITVNTTKEEKKQLEIKADEKGRSLSNFILNIVLKNIEDDKKK